jgi:CspA family cold shock protein
MCQRNSRLPNTNHQPRSEEELQPVTLHLKWFNGTKGFGFVVPEDQSFDAFLHITTLQQAGFHAIGEGAVLICSVYDGPKGKQVKEVLEVVDPGEVNLMPQGESEDGTVTMGGLVKWYKPEKGFGFIIPDDGMKDVFVHKTLLDRLEIEALEAGQRVRVTLKIVDRGREAVDVKIIR